MTKNFQFSIFSLQERGFTLIEAMIAITILALAVAGPLYAAGRSVVAAQIARDELIASALAQEGIEYVRLMRDNEYLATYQAGGPNVSATAWSGFISGADAASITSCVATTCTLDPARPMGTGSNLSLQPCSASTCTPLYLANGAYTQQSANQGSIRTAFTRTIQAISVGANDARIISVVSWSSRGVPYSVTVSDHLTPWQ